MVDLITELRNYALLGGYISESTATDCADEIERLRGQLAEARELIADGIDTIRMHTLIGEDGKYALRGSYRCVDDCELEQWEMRAEAAIAEPPQ